MKRKGALILTAALLGAAAWAIWMGVNLRSARIELAERSGEVTPERFAELSAFFEERDPVLAERVSPDLTYGEVWLDQMESLGKLDATRGRFVMWTGEATYVNRWPMSEFRGEYYLYNAWKRFQIGRAHV